MHKLRKLHLLACAPALAVAPTGAAWAQETGESSAGNAARIFQNDIVVTARKRSGAERAQDVPIALQALSGAQVEAMFSRNLTDIGMTMPNVRLDDGGSFPGVANFAIRGMGFNSTIASVEPTVGTFVDGIYLGVNLGGLMDTNDLESVEVLRGPQGTLFGRNVTGGAIVMRSARPTGEFGGLVKAGIGSHGQRLVAGSIQGGISDTLAAKVYSQYSEKNGDWKNITLGGRHGAEENFSVRPTVRWRPSSGVDITVIGEYGTMDGDGVASRFINDPEQLLYQQGIREPAGGAENLSINFRGGTDIRWYQGVLDMNFDVGPGTITSITGYREVDYSSSGDTDGSEADIARALNTMDQHQFSQELRYAATVLDDKLNFTIGAYYFTQKIEQFYHVTFFGASNQRSRGTLDHDSWSLFAQGDLEFMPDVFLTLGGRYNWEKKSARTGRTNECTLALDCTLTDEGSTTWSNFSPKVGLSWKITPDVMAYASWTKGFRSGGYNIRTTGARFDPAFPDRPFESAGPFDEETAKALEGGIKTEFLDGRARVNVAAFHNTYTGLQRTVNNGLVNYIANVASATVNGFEFEGTVLPIDDLSFTANVGYLDATYDDYFLPNSDVNLAGRRLVRAPEWSMSMILNYDLSLGSAGILTNRVSYTHNTRTPANDPGDYYAPAWEVIDASITWTPSRDSGLTASVWVKNLANEKYALLATYVGTLFTNWYQAPPRSFGAEVTYRF